MQGIQRVGQLQGVHVGRAHRGEGGGSAPPLGGIGARQHTGAVVDQNGLRRGEIGAGSYEGQTAILPEHGALPALHGDNGEVTAEAVGPVVVPRQLSQGQAVADGHPGKADEGAAGLILSAALHHLAAQGVGSVGHHQGDPCGRGGAHGVEQGGGVGEVAGAHVLHIEEKEVDLPQALGGGHVGLVGGCLVCSREDHVLKEGVGGNARQSVHPVADLFPGAENASDPMLGGKEGGDGVAGGHDLHGASPAVAGREPRGVGDEADALIFQKGSVGGFLDAVNADGYHDSLLRSGSRPRSDPRAGRGGRHSPPWRR